MNKPPTHRILVGNQRERTTLGRGFLSFFCLLGDNSILFRYRLVQRPFCTFLFFWCLIGNFLSFFAFSPSFDWEFSFFCFLSLFDWEFSFFVFFWGQGLTFSRWVKVYGKLGFWLKACRMAGHGICQGLGSGSGIKAMSHIISMIYMQQWWLWNFMQN